MSPDWKDEEEDDRRARLRRSYSPLEERGPVYNAQSALYAQRCELLGSYASLPVVYSSSPLLPYSQTVLDLWQRPGELSTALEPYIALFEALIQTPPPWYYAHATMLEAGRARATGTLMRVANTKRTSDGRLQVLVQVRVRVRVRVRVIRVRGDEGRWTRE